MKKTLAILLVCVLALGALAGCKKDEPSNLKILRYGVSGYNGNLMPVMADNVYDAQFVDLAFEGLVTTDLEGTYMPYLATWVMSNNNHTYTFTLKPGIKFNDGTPLTARDVEFTYLMMAHPDYNGPREYAVDLLEGYEAYHTRQSSTFTGIRVINDSTISFTYAEGEASPANIENFGYGIMNKAYYEAPTWNAFLTKLSTPGTAGGSGPFIITEYKPKELVRLVKSQNYWDIANKQVKIDEILGIEVSNDQILAALQTDRIDLGEADVNMDNYNALGAMPNVVRENFLANGYTFMCFNCKNGIFDEREVRQAFLYGLDRKAFIQVEYGMLASVGMAPISPVSWAFPDMSALNPYDYNPTLAGQLLDQAGWRMGSDGFRYRGSQRLTVRWLVYHESRWPSTLSGLASDTWRQLGIDLRIELMDFNTVADKTMDAPIDEKDFDIYTMGFSLSLDPDPKGALFDADAYSEGGFNASGYKNDRAQELIYLGRTNFNQAERAEIYKEFAILMNQEIPTVIIAYRNYLWGWRDRVTGIKMNAMMDWTGIDSIFDIDIRQ
jgi:peptide/nickel transport system substrate-binding protein